MEQQTTLPMPQLVSITLKLVLRYVPNFHHDLSLALDDRVDYVEVKLQSGNNNQNNRGQKSDSLVHNYYSLKKSTNFLNRC